MQSIELACKPLGAEREVCGKLFRQMQHQFAWARWTKPGHGHKILITLFELLRKSSKFPAASSDSHSECVWG